MIDKIPFAEIDCDLAIRRSLLEDSEINKIEKTIFRKQNALFNTVLRRHLTFFIQIGGKKEVNKCSDDKKTSQLLLVPKTGYQAKEGFQHQIMTSF